MKRIISLFMIFLLAVSCRDLAGKMDIYEDLVFKKKGNDIHVYEGNYNAKIKFSSKRKIKLKIDGKKITFRIPKGSSIPKENGNLYLTPEQTRQPYGLYGQVESKNDYSHKKEGYESCSWRRSYLYCHYNRSGYRSCYTRYYHYYGSRFVRFQDKTTQKDYLFKIVDPDSENKLAVFNATRTNKERIYQYIGYCR